MSKFEEPSAEKPPSDVSDGPKLRGFASFSITSWSRSAADISRLLNTAPSKSYEAGTEMNPRNPKSRIRNFSTWILFSSLGENSPVQEHLMEIAEFIDKNKQNILDLAKEGCRINCTCIFSADKSQSYMMLNQETLQKLSQIPACFIFEYM